MMPTRSIPGLSSLSSSKLLASRFSAWFTTPVTLPPGRASEATEATEPNPTGSWDRP